VCAALSSKGEPAPKAGPDAEEDLVADQVFRALHGAGVAAGPLGAMCASPSSLAAVLLGIDDAAGPSAQASAALDARASHAAGDYRLLVTTKLARALVSQRRGDGDAEMAELREVAGICGGRAAGRFFLRTASSSADAQGGAAVLSVAEEGWWWLVRYADVLLRIGDAWVRRGMPAK